MGINDAINHAFSLLKTGPSQEQLDAWDWAVFRAANEDPCCTEAKKAVAWHWELVDYEASFGTDATDDDKTRANIMNMECDELQEWLEEEIQYELEDNNDNHWTGNDEPDDFDDTVMPTTTVLQSLTAIQDQWDACSSKSFSDMKYAGEPIDIAHNFLKSQMSDVHIGFQEDPKREIERLRHQGISREEAMAMYQQYLDSLKHSA